jgi:hypothetical protein
MYTQLVLPKINLASMFGKVSGCAIFQLWSKLKNKSEVR